MSPLKKSALELLRQATAKLEITTTAIMELAPKNGQTPQDETQKIDGAQVGRATTKEAKEALQEANRLLENLFGVDRE